VMMHCCRTYANVLLTFVLVMGNAYRREEHARLYLQSHAWHAEKMLPSSPYRLADGLFNFSLNSFLPSDVPFFLFHLWIYLTLGHKWFVLTGKRGLCWRVEHPPATLCQHKSSQCCRVSARQHRDIVLRGDLTSTLARSLFYHYTTHSYASISGFHYTHIIPHRV
jgi:hypothetical protein